MRCRYCNIALEPSRSFVDGEFCCDDHRQSFESEGVYPTQSTQPVSAALQMLRQKFAPRRSEAASNMPEQEADIAAEPALMADSALEESNEPAEEQSFDSSFDRSGDEQFDTRPNPARETAASWRWINSAWKRAPRDLKLAGLVLPVLLVIGINGTLPKVPIEQLSPQNLDQVQKVVQLQWKNVNQTISERAAVAYADDFRSGLDAWQSRSNLTRS